MEINECNTSPEQNEEQKPHDHFNTGRKNIWQNSILFLDKNTKKLGIEENYLNVIKAIY